MKKIALRINKVILPLSISALVMTACGKSASETEAPEAKETDIFVSKEQFKAAEMEMGKPAMATFEEGFSISGVVAVPPQYRAEVSTYFPGYIKDIPFIEGQEVQKGEVLFTMQNPDFLDIQKDYLSASREVAYLEADYQRQKELWEDSVASQKVYLRARASYYATLSQREALAGKLRLMGIDAATFNESKMRSQITVRAPFSGFITEIMVSTGTYVSPQQIALRMMSTEHLHGEFTIYESDINKVDKGQQVTFKPTNFYGDSLYRGEIFAVNRRIDAQSKSTNIHVHMHHHGDKPSLAVGTYLEGKVITQQVKELALPAGATSKEAGKLFALKLVKSNAEGYYFRKVGLPGQVFNERYVSLAAKNVNFSAQDQFLIKGAYSLL